ncbi:MAG: restriction endonuclease [Candidatus Methanomethylicaceae archaeon]
MLDWKDFEQKVSEYFKQYGYLVKLNEEVSGSSGVSYEIDVLAYDKKFEEVKIACQCKAWTNPVDRDQILLWAKTCEDIHAIPAFASTSGYTSSALEVAKKANFILLTYDEQMKTIRKIGIITQVSLIEEPETLIMEAEQLLRKADKMIEQLNEFYEKELENSEEAKKLHIEIKNSINEAISLYKKALDLTKDDKWLWLKLGDIYDNYITYLAELREEKEYEEEIVKCYLNSLKKHLKGFPEILKRIGSMISIYQQEKLRYELEELFDVSLLLNDVRGFQIGLLKIYLEEYPNDTEALLRLPWHYINIDEIEKAEEACEKALKINPNDVYVISRLSHFYEDMANKSTGKKRLYFLNKTIESLKRYCEVDPENPSPWRRLAEIYSGKDLNEAIKYMEEAIKRDQKPTWHSWKRLGDLYLNKGIKEKAFECYSKALEAKSKDKTY